MSYNISKGDQKVGDLIFEEDPNTKIDFAADSISLTAGGETQLTIKPEGVLRLNTSISANTGRGEIVTFGTGSLATGKVHYFSSSGAWAAMDADDEAYGGQLLGIALGSATSQGLLLRGFFNAAAQAVTGFSTGKPIYLSATPGILTATPPSSSGQVVRVVGYCTDVSNVIYFDPSQDWLELGDPGVGSGGDWADALGNGASLDGVASFEAVGAPSATDDYAKIYAQSHGNDANTVLLLHCDGSDDGVVFTDSSVGGTTHVPTVSGAVTKTGVKQFGTASGFFDGSDDYLEVPYSTDFDFGSGDWTVETWYYPLSQISDTYIITVNAPTTDSGAYGQAVLEAVSSGSGMAVEGGVIGGSPAWTNVSSELALNTWHHIALVRNGTTVTCYVNGAPLSTTITVSGALTNSSRPVLIGKRSSGSHTHSNLDEIVITKGVAKYTSSFTPATGPYPITDLFGLDSNGNHYPLGTGSGAFIVTSEFSDWGDALTEGASLDGVASFKIQSASISNNADYAKIFALNSGDPDTDAGIKLYCKFNSVIDDDSSQSDRTMTGNGGASIDTTGGVPKYGAGCLKLLSASSQYVSTSTGYSDFFAAGDFTWDFWVKFSTVSSRQALIANSTHDDIEIELTTANKIFLHFRKASDGTAGAAHTGTKSDYITGQWYHVAIVRAGVNFRLYVDGTQDGATASGFAGAIQSRGSDMRFGQYGGGNYLNGFIDDLRFTNYARWASNFTPPAGEEDGDAEMYVQDELGNQTKISPHNRQGEWEYYSRNSKTGKTVRINMEELVRDIEQLTGKKYIKGE